MDDDIHLEETDVVMELVVSGRRLLLDLIGWTESLVIFGGSSAL